MQGKPRVAMASAVCRSEQSMSEQNNTALLANEIVLYMLHCGLDGKILQEVCGQYGLTIKIHQFPREELFAYHMHAKRRTPDLILIRGHFIPLTHDLDQQRHIPYLVVSSKLKYGNGQPVFIHAEQGYDKKDVLSIYHSIAKTIVEMIKSRHLPQSGTPPSDPADKSREADS